MSKETAESKKWSLLATAWELLALSFRRPDVPLAEAISSGEWASAAIEVSEALGIRLPNQFEAYGRAGEGVPTDEVFHVLRIEYTRLFIGAPSPVCIPYEGAWRTSGNKQDVLLFVNSYAMQVESFFKQCGLGRAEGANDPLDHIAIECELLEYLALLAGGLACFPEPSQGSPSLPYETPDKTYEVFLGDHAIKWMPRFAESAASETKHVFYKAASQLLLAVLEQT